MISLDMRTILFSHILTDLVCLAVVILLWRQSRKRFQGMEYWAGDFALQTMAAILISLRGSIPDWASMVLSNLLIVAGAILGYMGLVHFGGRKVAQIHNYFLLAVFGVIYAFYALAQPSQMARNLNLSVALLVIFGQCLWYAVFAVEAGMRRLLRGVGAVFVFYILVSVARIFGIFGGSSAAQDFFMSGIFEALILIAYQVLFIMLTYSLVLMVNQRLLVEVGTQEEKFAKVFRSSPYAITLTRLSDGRIVNVNDGFLNITGYQEAEIVGKTTVDLRLWEREDDRKAVVAELSQNGRLRGGEFQFRKKSGEKITGLISAEVISVNDQELVLSSISDITEQRHAEEGQRAALRKLKTMEDIVNHGPIMLFLWRGAPGGWPVELVSDNVESILGYSPDDIISGRVSWPGITHPEDVTRLEAEVERHFAEGIHEWSQEYRLFARSGEVRWLRDWNTAITDASGGITHIQALVVDITERKQVEEALIQSRLDMARAQEVGQIGSWRLDVHRDVLTWSDENHRIFGVPKGTTLTYETFLGAVHPDDRQYVDAQWNAGLAGQPYDIEHRIVAGGQIKWVREKAFLEFDEAGGLLGGFGITQDITERKQVEQSLRESEERYRNTLDNMMEGCQIIGFDWRYLYVNDVAASHGRQAKEQLLGRTMLEVYPDIEHTDMFDALRECMQARLPHRLENEFLYPDGTKSWFDLRMNPVAEGVFILSIDITERKLAEEALARERGLLRTLVDNLPEEIYVKDREHRFLLVNQLVVSALGASGMEEVIGRRDEDFFPAGEAQSYSEEEDEIMTHGRSIIDDTHTRVRPSDGQQWYLRTKIPLRDSAGRIVGLIGTGRNITERKQAEQALLESERKFSTMFEKAPFAASLSNASDGRLADVNEAFTQIFGYTREEAIGRTSLELNINPDAEGRARLLTALREQGSARNEELVLHTKSGRAQIFSVNLDVLEMGGTKYILNMTQDITARKRAEDEARQRMMEIEDLYRNAPVGLCVLDADLRWVRINEHLARINGFPARDHIGRTVRELIPLLADVVEAPMRQILASGEPLINIEITDEATEGQRHWLASWLPIKDAGGAVVGINVVAEEVTERKQAEQALAAAHAEIVNERNRLQALMEALPVGVSFLDSSGGDVLSNKYFEHIWGGSRPFVHGVDDYAAYRAWWADSGQPLQPEEWASAQAVRTGRAATGQLLKIQRFDGSLAYVLNSASPIFGQQDQVVGCAVAIQDVTELKRREDEVRQLNRTLKALSDSNQVMLRVKAEQNYLDEICRLIVEDCGHAMVWIGYAEDDEQKSVRPVASAGFEQGYLETLNITWGDGERGRGPTGTAIRSGQASLCNNMLTDPNFAPWREQAIKRGYASSLVLPLVAGDKVFGVINIYAREPEAFSAEEKKLLEELASDLSYGIATTRMREAHAQAEKALRQSEERYRSLFNSMTEGFALHEIICDENGLPCDYRFIEINPSFEQLTGLQREMVVGRTVREVIPGIEQSWIDTYGRVALTGQPAHFDNYSAVLDRHYEVYAHCPAPFQFAVLFVDVTARKRAEDALHQLNNELEQRVAAQTTEIVKANVDLEQRIAARTSELQTANHDLQTARLAALNLMEDALDAKKELEKVNAMLRESEERFRLALKNAPVTVATQDNDLRFTWAYNQRTVRPAEVIGRTDTDLFPAETAARLVALKHQVLESGAEVKEQMWVGSGGQQVYLDVYLEPIRDSSGDITGVGIATVDLTDRVRAEQALQAAHDQLELRVQERTQELVKEIAERREVERRLRIQTTAMEAAANGIVITDHQGNIEWTNPALTRISSYEARDLIGRNMSVFSSGQHDREYYRHLWDTILAGQVWRGEMVNRRRDGSLYVEEQTITPVFDENEQIPHFISIKQDITERKQAEAELERRNLELQSISAAEHEQRQLAEALVQAALVLNKSLRLEEIFALLLDEVRGVIPYQLADIILLDGDSFYNASRRSDPDWPDPQAALNTSFQLDDFPMLKEMRQSGQPVLVADTQQMADWVGVEGLASCRSFLSAPLLVEKKVIGFVNLFANEPEFFTRRMSDRLVAFAAHAAVAIQNAWLFEQVRAGSERLQSLSRRLVEVQENERLYIARELHDEAGQALTSLLVQLQLLENQAAAQKDVSQITTDMENSINEVLENLHRVAMALRPASLDHVGLVAALRQHVEAVGVNYGLKVSFKAASFQKRLPSNVETNLYRIVQEAMTNVVRHARATQVDVVLTVRDDKLVVIVEDNGIGFDPHTVQSDKHLGLFGMRERVDTIGGKIVIESEPGKGTTIMVEVEYGASDFDR